MKRFLSLILVIALTLSLSVITGSTGFGVFAEAEEQSYIPEEVDLTGREDFGLGINTHAKGYAAYPEKYLEQQIHAVAKSGSKWIRINGDIPTDGDWTYNDLQVGLANKYGLKIVMVTSPSIDNGLEYITLYYETLARRYNGEDGRGYVDVIQAWNEKDLGLLSAKWGNSSTRGDKEEDYFNIPVAGPSNDLTDWLTYFKAAEEGIHCKESKTKFMINYSQEHSGMVKYMLRNGLKLDYVGWDIYVDYPGDLEASAKRLEGILDGLENDVAEKYGVPYIVCETNLNMHNVQRFMQNNGKTLNDVTFETYQPWINFLYMFYNRPWVKAAIAYELLDEPAMSGPEAYFGLISNPSDPVENSDGGIGITDEKYEKDIYKELVRLFKGDRNLRMVDRSEVNLKPYEKLVVDTADDSNIDMDKENNSSEEIESIPEINWEEDEPIDTDDVILEDTVIDDETEKEVEEVIIENLITPVKDVKTRQTSYKMPWGVVIGVGIGLIVLAAGAVTAYLLISKKKKLSK